MAAALALSLAVIAHASPSAVTQKEIDHLLTYMEASKCAFYRNGNRYDAQKAGAHLRHKYGYLQKMNRIGSAEDFIEKAATQSSLSGQPYQIQCGSQAAVPSHQWLSDELARYRAATPE